MLLGYVGATVLSGVASNMAANNASGTLRIPIRQGIDSFWNDWRTWLGLGGAAAQLLPDSWAMVRTGAHTVGLGAATSLAATEAVRASTIRQIQQGGVRPVGPQTPQVPAYQQQQQIPQRPPQQVFGPPVQAQQMPAPAVRGYAGYGGYGGGYGVW